MEDTTTINPPYRWALATFGVILALYVFTLGPTTAFWDTSEYIAAAKVLGVPHPPGNPLFTLMAHVWGMIPWAADYAMRINFFAAVTSAAGAAFWFLVAERWLRNIMPARLPRLASAFAGILVSATAWSVWNQSTVNEKVYTVSLLSIALISWLTVRWADLPSGERRDRFLVAAIYLTALSSTNHQMGILALPVIGLYVLFTDWRVVLRPRVVTAIVVAAVVGVSLNYIYLPLRAAQHPPINEGEPIGFFSKQLMDVLNRVQYGKPPLGDRQSDLPAQLSMYWTYWSWQWARDIGWLRGLATGLFTAFSLGGLIAMIKRDRRAGIAAGALLFTLTLLLIYYLNFKYGFSYHRDDPSVSSEMREVRERDYFFLASFAFVGVLVAAGFAAAIRGIGEWLGDRAPEGKRWTVGMPVLLLALIPLIGNRVTAPRSHETLARDFAIDMLESVEPYGILITAGDNDTFPLWFAQEVLKVRPDITLANLSLMNTEWHLKQIARRETPTFDPTTADPFWKPQTDTSTSPLGGSKVPTTLQKPTNKVLNLSDAQIDSLNEVVASPANGTQIDSLKITYGAQYLTRSDVAAALLIIANLGHRKIYFSWSDGNYPDQTLGLGNYLVTEGLVRRLMPAPVKAGGTIRNVEGIGFMDVERTRALMFGVYHSKVAAQPRPAGWVDEPSASILSLYQLIYQTFAPVLRAAGDSVHAKESEAIAKGVCVNLRNPAWCR